MSIRTGFALRLKMNIEITLLLSVIFGISSTYCVNNRYFPRFHLSPPHGWMNDPNGFCYYKGEYHMFYQYNPKTSMEAGVAHWGHAKSADLIHWEHLPIALYPDQWYDQTGVFSGSAFIEDNIMYLYYTGNVNRTSNEPLLAQFQALAISTDGINIQKYENNPIMYTPNYQPNTRDPKVWKHNDSYYMILGNSYDNNTKGQVLIYKSEDKFNWEEMCILDKSDGSFGYMWECPDFFELNGKFVLLFSPQGLDDEGDKYQNQYQTGYIIAEFDYKTCAFTKLSEFRELDHGHDFYASQTTLDPHGRRIVVAWANTWEYVYPDRQDGWSGLLINARTLTLTQDLRLLQAPVKEINYAVGKKLYSGNASTGMRVRLPDKAGKVELEWSTPRNIEVVIESFNKSESVTIKYDHQDGRVILDRGGDDGIRRTYWDPRGHFKWTIYIDASLIELFCGDGETTFTSRYFPEGVVSVRIGAGTRVDRFRVHAMRRTVPAPVPDSGV